MFIISWASSTPGRGSSIRRLRSLKARSRINPYHTLAHLNLGQIYWYEFKNREKALYHLRAALMIDPLLPVRNQVRALVRMIEGGS